MTAKRTHKVDVFAAQKIAKIEHEIQKMVATMPSHIPIHLHRDNKDWCAQLNEQLCQHSLWGDQHLVILHIEEKELKILANDWFKHWLVQPSSHHLIISLFGSYANKHKILQHKNIMLHNLYEREHTLSLQDKEAIGHHPDGLLWLDKLKSQQPLQYEQWLQTIENLSMPERLQTLQTYYHTQSSMIFLTWVQVLLEKQSFDILSNLNTSDIMECFNMVSAWVRSGLLDEEKQTGPSSGLMRWPEAKSAWTKFQKTSTRKERYQWYLQWIQQESTLKGMDHPMNHAHAWQACLRLTQQWLERIANPS